MNFDTELWKHGNEICVGITIMLSNTTCRMFPLIDLDLYMPSYVCSMPNYFRKVI